MIKYNTRLQANAILGVINGADVFGLGLAYCLRQVEKEHPEFITITDPAGEYDGADRLPYFGAIATSKGIAWAKEHKNDPDEEPARK